jgi:hypothetical protein
MSTLRKLGASVAAVLLTAGVGLTASAPAEAATAGGVEAARTVLPFHGHYQGRDFHNRSVTFYFDGHHIRDFRINGHAFVTGAPVQGGQVHHYCSGHPSKCIRGHWSHDTTFDGQWNDPNQGHSVPFVARVISH